MTTKPSDKDLRTTVEQWRMHVLTEAGYPENDALSIAYSNVDLHRACELLRNGCAVATAVEILL
jgi:hypothetical protein